MREVRDERELVRRCREGSEAAYAELVRSHRPRLYLLAFRLTGDRETAEDVVQEAFLAAFRSIEKVDPRPSLSPWLNTIVLRMAGRAGSRARSRAGSSLDQATQRESTARHRPRPGIRRGPGRCRSGRRSPRGCRGGRAAPRPGGGDAGAALQVPGRRRPAPRHRPRLRRGGAGDGRPTQHLQEPPPARNQAPARGARRPAPAGDPGPSARSRYRVAPARAGRRHRRKRSPQRRVQRRLEQPVRR